MSARSKPLEAMCRHAVQRIMAGEARYDEELDRLCDQFGAPREKVQPILDEMMIERRDSNPKLADEESI